MESFVRQYEKFATFRGSGDGMETYMKKRVLVVGGSYFIGRSIVNTFLNADYDVYVLNRGHVPVWDKRIHQIICDRDNGSMLKEALYKKEFEIVIDVCGLDSKQAERLCSALDRECIETFIFISSSAVYDIKSLDIPYKEGDSLAENPYWWDYGTDKIKAESYYRGHFIWTKTRLVILRPAYVYGENNYVQRESFIFKHVEEHKPVLIPASNPRLQFVYAPDLADFALKAAQSAKENISIYNIGNSESLTARQWVEACAAAAGGYVDIIEYDYETSGRNVRDFFPFYDYDNVLDVSKMKSLFHRETLFLDGLKNAYLWYRANAGSIEFKKNVAMNEEQILKELEDARIKAEQARKIRTADNDDAEVQAWFEGQRNAMRESIDLGNDEDFDTDSIEVRRKRDDDKKEREIKAAKESMYVSKDKTNMRILDVQRLLSQDSEDVITTDRLVNAMNNSECYALYENDIMVGFARVVTDKAVVAYISDFVINKSCTGSEYEAVLRSFIENDEVLSDLNIVSVGGRKR